jgi:hypothetical protein
MNKIETFFALSLSMALNQTGWFEQILTKKFFFNAVKNKRM